MHHAPAQSRARPVRTAAPSLPDGVTFLTVYLVLLVAVPSGLRFTALGTLGSPALLWGLVGLVAWAAGRIVGGQPLTWRHGPVTLAAVVFALAVGASYVAATARGSLAAEGDTADTSLARLMSWAGVLLMAHDGIHDVDRLLVLLRRFTLVAGMLALLGLLQFATGQILIDWIALPGMSIDAGPYLEERGRFSRASGTAAHPLEFGTVLCMTLPFALSLAVFDRQQHPAARWGVVLAIATSASLSTSRSALIGLAVALSLLLVGWPRRMRLYAMSTVLAFAVVIYLTVPGMGGLVLGLFRDVGSDSSTLSRIGASTTAIHVLEGSPWVGRGLGTFVPHYIILDNQLLLLLIEIGLLGVATFAVLCLTGMLCGLRGRAASVDPLRRDLGQAVLASIATGVVLLAFFDGLAFPMVGGTLFLVLGLAGAYHRLVTATPAESSSSGAAS